MDRREFIKLIGACSACGAAAAAMAVASSPSGAPARPQIAIIAPFDSCPAGERPFAMRVAKHLKRWIGVNGILADVEDDREIVKALAGRRLAILVMCATPAAQEITALEAFVKRGGKILAFYGTSSALAKLMEVQLVKYMKPAPGTFAEIVFVPNGLAEAPKSIVQSSPNIFAARPAGKNSRTIAMWHNRKGASVKEPAVIATPHGWWVTHIFTADGDERAKELFLLAAIGQSVPGAWEATLWRRRVEAKNAAERAYAAKQKPRPGEIHAVWEQSGEGLYPGDWKRTIKELEEQHITDIYVNTCGASFAHYPSKILPASAVLASAGNQLKAALEAAKGSKVRVHAWVKCFMAERATPAVLAGFSARKWRMVHKDGSESNYLDPSNPALRAYLVKALAELAGTYAVDGIHLDFIRWTSPLAVTRTTPGAMARFNATKLPPTDENLVKWRARQIETFLAAARTKIKAIRPDIQFSAAVLGGWKGAYHSMGQDWKTWMDRGLVDKIVPMDYTEKNKEFAAWTAEQGSTDARARKVVAGIGVTANESRLTAKQVTDQILLARRAKLAGVAFFDLDWTLMHDILPVLRCGVI